MLRKATRSNRKIFLPERFRCIELFVVLVRINTVGVLFERMWGGYVMFLIRLKVKSRKLGLRGRRGFRC